jgi:hypothetical protein
MIVNFQKSKYFEIMDVKNEIKRGKTVSFTDESLKIINHNYIVTKTIKGEKGKKKKVWMRLLDN